jgi:hypothetical protein
MIQALRRMPSVHWVQVISVDTALPTIDVTVQKVLIGRPNLWLSGPHSGQCANLSVLFSGLEHAFPRSCASRIAESATIQIMLFPPNVKHQ